MKGKTINIILYTLAALIVFAGVHMTQEFRFYTMESNDLFIYDAGHVMQTLMQPGGSALLIASFLTQFMRIPFVGTLVATAVYMIVGVLIINMLRKRRGGSAISGLSFVPVATCIFALKMITTAFRDMSLSFWHSLSYGYSSPCVRSVVGSG